MFTVSVILPESSTLHTLNTETYYPKRRKRNKLTGQLENETGKTGKIATKRKIFHSEIQVTDISKALEQSGRTYLTVFGCCRISTGNHRDSFLQLTGISEIPSNHPIYKHVAEYEIQSSRKPNRIISTNKVLATIPNKPSVTTNPKWHDCQSLTPLSNTITYSPCQYFNEDPSKNKPLQLIESKNSCPLWRPLYGLEDQYEISNYGDIRDASTKEPVQPVFGTYFLLNRKTGTTEQREIVSTRKPESSGLICSSAKITSIKRVPVERLFLATIRHHESELPSLLCQRILLSPIHTAISLEGIFKCISNTTQVKQNFRQLSGHKTLTP